MVSTVGGFIGEVSTGGASTGGALRIPAEISPMALIKLTITMIKIQG